MSSVTLVEFLTARLDELERAARLCSEAYPGEWELSDRGWKATVRADEPAFRVVSELEQDQAVGLDTGWLGGYLQHITDHSPAVVLADIAAKRRIFQIHHGSGVSCPVCSLGAEDGVVVHELEPCGTLKLLALPFADRPGFDEAWRP